MPLGKSDAADDQGFRTRFEPGRRLPVFWSDMGRTRPAAIVGYPRAACWTKGLSQYRRSLRLPGLLPRLGATDLTMRAAALAALMMMPVLTLGACSPSGRSAAGGADQGKFAGLDGQILSWRQAIIASDALCRSQAEGEKCEGFEVACKAEQIGRAHV